MATEKIDLNNLDKSDWKTYRFDEIAQNISERIDPNNTDLEVYIGLEHIDSESLHIKRHGTPDDVNGTKLKFYKDDIIFGRRRAYQRKAGIATCDGFCSAHALVLRANPDVIDPALFPFFMHSDLFMNRAVDISVGSLSPTINWGTLKHQEFILPSKETQSKLIVLLQNIENVVLSERILFEKVDLAYKSKAKNISFLKCRPKNEILKLKDICTIKDNLRKPLNSNERELMPGNIPYYGANGIVGSVGDYIFDEDLVLLAEDGGNFSEFYTKEVAYIIRGKSWVNNHAHVLAADKEIVSTNWLFYSLVHKNILEYIIGTTRMKLNKSDMENIRVWVPSESVMDRHTKEMNALFQSRECSSIRLKAAIDLKKSIIGKVI